MNQSGHLKKHENEHVWKSKLLKIKNSILELEKDIRGVKDWEIKGREDFRK